MSDDAFDLDDDWWDCDDLDDEDVEPDRGPWWGVWGLGLPEHDDPVATGAPKTPEPYGVYVFPYLDGPLTGSGDYLLPGRPGDRVTPAPRSAMGAEDDGVWQYHYAWRGDGFRVAAKVRLAFDDSRVEVIDDSPPSPDVSGALQQIVPNGWATVRL